MTFIQRELWIYVLTVMHTSQMAQQAGKKTRQVIELYLRKELCPDITTEQWLDIEKDIVRYKNTMMELLSIGVLSALGRGNVKKEDIEFFKKLEGITADNKETMLKLIDENKDKFGEMPEMFKDVYKKLMDAKKELEGEYK